MEELGASLSAHQSYHAEARAEAQRFQEHAHSLEMALMVGHTCSYMPMYNRTGAHLESGTTLIATLLMYVFVCVGDMSLHAVPAVPSASAW